MEDAGQTTMTFADAADVAQLFHIINSSYGHDDAGADDDGDDVFVQTVRAPARSTPGRLHLTVSSVAAAAEVCFVQFIQRSCYLTLT